MKGVIASILWTLGMSVLALATEERRLDSATLINGVLNGLTFALNGANCSDFAVSNPAVTFSDQTGVVNLKSGFAFNCGGPITSNTATLDLDFKLESPAFGSVIPTSLTLPSITECSAGVSPNINFPNPSQTPIVNERFAAGLCTFLLSELEILVDIVGENILLSEFGLSFRLPRKPIDVLVLGAETRFLAALPDGFDLLEKGRVGTLPGITLNNILQSPLAVNIQAEVNKILTNGFNDPQILTRINKIFQLITGDDSIEIPPEALTLILASGAPGIIVNIINGDLTAALIGVQTALNNDGFLSLLPEEVVFIIDEFDIPETVDAILALLNGGGNEELLNLVFTFLFSPGMQLILPPGVLETIANIDFAEIFENLGSGNGIGLGNGQLLEEILGFISQFSNFTESGGFTTGELITKIQDAELDLGLVLFLLSQVNPATKLSDFIVALSEVPLPLFVGKAQAVDPEGIIVLLLGPLVLSSNPVIATVGEAVGYFGVILQQVFLDVSTLLAGVPVQVTIEDTLATGYFLLLNYLNIIASQMGNLELSSIFGAILITDNLSVLSNVLVVDTTVGELPVSASFFGVTLFLPDLFAMTDEIRLSSSSLVFPSVSAELAAELLVKLDFGLFSEVIDIALDFTALKQEALTFAVSYDQVEGFGWGNALTGPSFFSTAQQFVACGVGSVGFAHIASVTNVDMQLDLSESLPGLQGVILDLINLAADLYAPALPTLLELLAASMLDTELRTLTNTAQTSAICAANVAAVFPTASPTDAGDNGEVGEDIGSALPIEAVIPAAVGAVALIALVSYFVLFTGGAAAASGTAAVVAGSTAASATTTTKVPVEPTPEEKKMADMI